MKTIFLALLLTMAGNTYATTGGLTAYEKAEVNAVVRKLYDTNFLSRVYSALDFKEVHLNEDSLKRIVSVSYIKKPFLSKVFDGRSTLKLGVELSDPATGKVTGKTEYLVRYKSVMAVFDEPQFIDPSTGIGFVFHRSSSKNLAVELFEFGAAMDIRDGYSQRLYDKISPDISSVAN